MHDINEDNDSREDKEYSIKECSIDDMNDVELDLNKEIITDAIR